VRAGSIPELVDERVGELADLDDPISLAAAVRRLYDRGPEALGAAARERALQRFTWTHAMQTQLASYASVMGVARSGLAARPAMEFGSPGS
jgi:alpha-1,6-mannosyltransferase